MIYQYSSVKEVIGNVIRNTRLQDTSYILDLPEWIGQAMSFMRTKMESVYKYKDITQNFHIGSLPAGLISVECVEYNGMRLTYAGGRTPASRYGFSQTMRLTEWENLPVCKDSYYTEMGYLKTPSLCDANLRIHYKSIPVDEDGFPLVPDNANYKQALYWHSRAMMIGAGYEDKTFTYEYCDAQYEKYAARAIAGINYPSTDIAASRVQYITRFLPGNYLSYFGLGTIEDSSPASGFIAQMPSHITESITETEYVTIGDSTYSFNYDASGTEGSSVTISVLQNRTMLQLFLDNYLLVLVDDVDNLTPNTYMFDSQLGKLTFANTLGSGQNIQGLYKPTT